MFNKKQLEQKILDFDLYISEILEEGKFALLVIGGASLIMTEITERNTTTDIDVFVSDLEEWNLTSFEDVFGDEIAEDISFKYDINSHVCYFKLKEIIPSLNIKYKKFRPGKWVDDLKCIELYTLDIEGIVLTKLLAMMDEDPKRKDRDFIDIKDCKDFVDFKKLEKYINIWKKDFAKKSQLEKFDKAYNRWINS